jgi:hypothetical protein
MIRRLLTIVLLLVAQAGIAPASELAVRFARHAESAATVVDHAAWDRLLARFVETSPDKVNRLDYRRFRSEGRDALLAYIRQLEGIEVSRLARKEQFAFWINLYNAGTVAIVLDHYPVASIRDIAISPGLFTVGPWKKKVVTVEGVALSLDDIEHEILRPIWRDPRIHYAANCASIGCPNLAREAFVGARLEQQLDQAARDYINHPRGISVRGDAVVASKIYSWYVRDFGGDDAGVLSHLRRYAAADLRRRLERVTRIHSYVYDWRLNDAAPNTASQERTR